MAALRCQEMQVNISKKKLRKITEEKLILT